MDVTPISLPGYQPNLPVLQHMYLKSKLNNKRQNELIPYNDCLYRNLYRYCHILAPHTVLLSGLSIRFQTITEDDTLDYG